MVELEHPEGSTIFTEQGKKILLGRSTSIQWRDNGTCPTEEEYKKMVSNRTASLFELCVRLADFFTDYKKDFGALNDTMGLYYHVRADYINLLSQSNLSRKPYLEDLAEGNFIFPAIHAIHNSDSHEVISILFRFAQ
ncbi:hypothetical protein ScPMuIL_009151 [Solemya velum]